MAPLVLPGFFHRYLANDMEEDNQGPKQDIFYFLYGKSYAQRPMFHKLRFQFIRSMGWRIWVSREECEEVWGVGGKSMGVVGVGGQTGQTERGMGLKAGGGISGEWKTLRLNREGTRCPWGGAGRCSGSFFSLSRSRLTTQTSGCGHEIAPT